MRHLFAENIGRRGAIADCSPRTLVEHVAKHRTDQGIRRHLDLVSRVLQLRHHRRRFRLPLPLAGPSRESLSCGRVCPRAEPRALHQYRVRPELHRLEPHDAGLPDPVGVRFRKPCPKSAWAVGCSEAQGSYGYASSRGITSAAGWWLDVETQNSWCGQPGTACTDLSLNQYTLQGLIDTLTHIGAVPIGIYSNRTQWSSIVGNLSVTGPTSDWVATGARTAQEAVTYCAST